MEEEREPLEPIWEDESGMPDFEKEFWDEDDWERFMTVQDRKVDELLRLDELFLASGMESKDLELMGFEPCDQKCEECEERYSCWEYQERLAEESRKATGQPSESIEDAMERDFRQIPAYKTCFDFGLAAIDLMKNIPDKDYETDADLRKLAENCCVASAKIAGGHAMGYRPYSICGNIAKCKRGLNALVASLEALDALAARPALAEKALRLKEMGEAALKELRVRVEELRAEARRIQGRSAAD